MAFSRKYEWSLGLKPNALLLFVIKKRRIRLVLTDDVFLPHPDSLLLAHSMKVNARETVCDLGTGSGILAIAAAMLGASKVFASDINRSAIDNAVENAAINGVKSRCTFRAGSWFVPFPNRKFNIILANPPQIPGKGAESAYFRVATEAGKDGTAPTILVLKDAKMHLKKKGRVYIVLKEWMDWKKVLHEMGETYYFRKIGETFSPVWTKDKARLKSILALVSGGKARFYRRGKTKYWKIYAYECTLK